MREPHSTSAKSLPKKTQLVVHRPYKKSSTTLLRGMLKGMKLTWYGQATFYVEAADGTTLVTDPYNFETSGYAPLEKEADVVVMSSATDDFHNNAHLVRGQSRCGERPNRGTVRQTSH